MKNIVLCFDHSGESNATALFRLVDHAGQVGWRQYTNRRPEDARASVASAYTHLVDHWHPGDNVYVFGAGSGAACAQALTRLLGTIGVLDGELRSYMLSTYALPRTTRTAPGVASRHRGRGRPGRARRHHAAGPLPGSVGFHPHPRDRRAGQRDRGPPRGGHRRRTEPAARRRCGRGVVPRLAPRHRLQPTDARLDARRRRAGRVAGGPSTFCACRVGKLGTEHGATPACPRTPSCTPASRCTCGRIRGTGAGCPPRSNGPIRTGWTAASG